MDAASITARGRRLLLALALAGAVACTDHPLAVLPPQTPYGRINVSVGTRTGQNYDSNGYWVVMDSALQGYGVRFFRAPLPGGPGRGDTVMIFPVLLGMHTLSITDVSSNCTIVDGKDRVIFMDEPRTISVGFDLRCQ